MEADGRSLSSHQYIEARNRGERVSGRRGCVDRRRGGFHSGRVVSCREKGLTQLKFMRGGRVSAIAWVFQRVVRFDIGFQARGGMSGASHGVENLGPIIQEQENEKK